MGIVCLLRRQSMYPVPQAFVSAGYSSLLRNSAKRKGADSSAGAWAMLEGHLLALGSGGVCPQALQQV